MFPNSVKAAPALGVPGDFANTNPRTVVPALSGELVAGDNGVQVGLFGWRDPTTPAKVNNFGTGKPTGFIARSPVEGTITTYLAEASLRILRGKEVTLFSGGDFLVKNEGGGAATRGMKAFASLTTGQVGFDAAGATPSGYIETDFFVAITAAVGDMTVITRTL